MAPTASLSVSPHPPLKFRQVRQHTESLADALTHEDQSIQSMPDASPTKWHLAHTSWFFETMLLKKYLPNYKSFHTNYDVLFNSYYNSIGEQYPRSQRGMITRPSCHEVFDYRQHVDNAVNLLFETASPEQLKLIEVGLHHEQQHQELLLTDIKHLFSKNPTYPAYRAEPRVSEVASRESPPLEFIKFEGGVHKIGHRGPGFHFDNESPHHDVIIQDFQLANRPINNAEVIEFIKAGGYEDPLLWLSDGWAFRNSNDLKCPLYFLPNKSRGFDQFSLHGLHPINPAETACHLTYFEADAIARFMGARLPTEQEWELAASQSTASPPSFNPAFIRPGVPKAEPTGALSQIFGGVWEWTQSPYVGYPGYLPNPGALGEYNGKFMHNQLVLRGGSCATSDGHLRASYRNFFPSHAQWQFTGARLARTKSS